MDGVGSYLSVSLVIIGLLGLLIIIRHWLHAIVSNRRMFRMMLASGIDETAARNPGQLLDIDMQDARRRCRRCPTPETCDRWLNGDTLPGNDFCPNAARFMAAIEPHPCRVTDELARKPGRRLD